jgi:glucose dehydrogenase
MTPFERNGGAVAGINVNFLMSCLFGVGAWAVWPTSIEWWGLGVMSVMLGLAAFGNFANAIRAMVALHAKERVLAEYLAQGDAPKSAELASEEKLRQAGMVE